jgi:Ca2+-binding RTX toxin-like protein
MAWYYYYGTAASDSFDLTTNYYYPSYYTNLYAEGSAGSDSLSGGAYNDYLDGGAGNDYLYGRGGDDYIDGGAGNDDLYGGAGYDTMYGGTGNDYIDGGTGYDAMYGGTGNDTYIVDSTYDTVSEYAGGGTNDWVYSSVSYSLGSNVENLYVYGTAYSGVGNSLDNTIYGNTYDNYLDGGTGYDTMYGGSGNDIYVVDSAYDTVSEYAGEGTSDWVYSSVSYSLGSNVENLYVYGTAYSGVGNSLDNVIYGNSSSNYLDGGTGNDAMYGGSGNDTYVVDSSYDTVSEYASEGTNDWVYSSVSYSLGSNVENLYVYGTAYSGVGNSLDNVIYGNTYDNYLSGGAGYDTMYGGTGNDIYVVDSAYDTVNEYAGEGTDTVYSYVNYTLGSNVENLYLYGTANSGSGNSLDNVIVGNYYYSSDLGGGAGNDAIYGGYYNDKLYGGYDNDYMSGGYGDDYFDGEYGDDTLYGGYGDDYVNGGTGNDAMYAGYGNDIYLVDSAYDTVNEYAGEGTSDWVYSSISYSLGSNIENLYVMGTAYSGVGNSLDNVIYGNSSGNYLDGGYGNDTVYGGSGNDSVYGYYGDDYLSSGYGNDTVYGEYGDDYISGGYGNDIVVGGYGNDTVNGYGGGSTEVDYLYGRTGGYNYGYADADTYVLGDAYGAYYNGASSYAIVTDYTYSEGDKIQLYGSSSNYAVAYGNYGGTSATDTYLYSYSASAGYDLVGIVQDATTLNISYV